MAAVQDGPKSPRFMPSPYRGNATARQLAKAKVSEAMKANAGQAPTGRCVSWGIPFEIGRFLVAIDKPVAVSLSPVRAPWLVFMHTSDGKDLEWNRDGFLSPTRGVGRLGEAVADYVLVYEDGSECRHTVRRRHEIGMVGRPWGENCFASVAHMKPRPVRPATEQPVQGVPWAPQAALAWGQTQTRVMNPDILPWVNWLWAWENPKPRAAVVGLRVEPREGAVVLSGISAGNVASMPLRWGTRRKAVLRLPKGAELKPELDRYGCLEQIQLDLGQVISAQRRTVYPDASWAMTYNNQLPVVSDNEILVEYAAHPEARFHLWNGKTVAVANLEAFEAASGSARSARGRSVAAFTKRLTPVAPAAQRVRLRVIEKGSRKPVPVKLHVHGEAGEYLAPVDRHRIPNAAWFEDYSVDFAHQNTHFCTYINGEAFLELPLGRVYIEVSKGLEIRPVRKAVEITPGKRAITITIEKALPWRERGWVSADTHVHFLSPQSALVEGAAEGVNVVNLLASQWGELFTNIGDFDGKTTYGSREAGGDGEYLVRVGTENRQHVLGHMSLLGYQGGLITPVTTGGTDESALGDAVEVLLSEWARQCRKQGGIVVLPHFPNPRCEGASCIVHGDIDAVEMTSWGNLYMGIDPYSLSDWYRYLNCGYFVPAVAGTDKMSANTPVGCIRTYARIPKGRPFTYAHWMEAVRSGDTFVSYGPLLEFSVEGKAPGKRIPMKRSGGTVTVEWQVASVTMPMSRVDLVVNGEIRESRRVKPNADDGYWTVRTDRSSWLALLVRGHYPDKAEIIAAHSSPVMVEVAGSPFFAAADAVTILEQIEGALVYLDTVGTRADDAAYKRMRLILTSAHRRMHNRMHREGRYHVHSG